MCLGMGVYGFGPPHSCPLLLQVRLAPGVTLGIYHILVRRSRSDPSWRVSAVQRSSILALPDGSCCTHALLAQLTAAIKDCCGFPSHGRRAGA